VLVVAARAGQIAVPLVVAGVGHPVEPWRREDPVEAWRGENTLRRPSGLRRCKAWRGKQECRNQCGGGITHQPNLPSSQHARQRRPRIRHRSPALAVAATSPGYAAASTAPYAVHSPPTQAASCASTTNGWRPASTRDFRSKTRRLSCLGMSASPPTSDVSLRRSELTLRANIRHPSGRRTGLTRAKIDGELVAGR
jgi:hypothetical protein